jgi:hypothetical protein
MTKVYICAFNTDEYKQSLDTFFPGIRFSDWYERKLRPSGYARTRTQSKCLSGKRLWSDVK